MSEQTKGYLLMSPLVLAIFIGALFGPEPYAMIIKVLIVGIMLLVAFINGVEKI